jgi:glucosylceramidase
VRLILQPLLCALLLANATRPLSAQEKTPARGKRPIEVRVYEASQETSGEPQEQAPLRFASTRAPELTIHVDDTIRFQRVEGFGASLTDSSAWLLANKLTEAQRKEWLGRLFDPEKGIGLNLLRQPMGASDFALEGYTYDDVPPGASDPNLEKFSIEKDQRYIVPLLREILAINRGVKVIATPWSPPAWMKSSQSLIKGTLNREAYPALANYFVKFVDAYQKAGVPIFAITPQNEPLNIPVDYTGMGMSPAEQGDFLSGYLGPAFHKAGLKTKIFIFDHNWDLIHFPLEVLSEPEAARYASGVATHCYGGNPSAQEEIHSRYQNLPIWMTECSGGDWQKENLLVQQTRLIIESMRNWTQTVILWNLALDQNHGPHLGGCKDCRGVLTIRHGDAASEVIPSVDFTALAMASKFARRGAVRVSSNTFGPGSLEDVAFRNSDGSLALLVLNSSARPVTFNIAWSGKFAIYTLDPFSAATFVWQGYSSPH